MRVDFRIYSRPVFIELECPYCEYDIHFLWDEIDVPDCWEDAWGEVTCPYCNKSIELGDYEYD